MNGKRFDRAMTAGAAAIDAYGVLLAAYRPWHTRWGATDDEIQSKFYVRYSRFFVTAECGDCHD